MSATSMIGPRDIALLTVTYGNRLDSLIPVIEATLKQGVGRVVVVCNGVSSKVETRLRAYRSDPSLELVVLPSNQGSAPGYARGLEAAFSDPATAVALLLDDDNIPAPDCVTHLVAALNADSRGAVCALRADIPYIVDVARHGRADAMHLPAGQVFSYDLRAFSARALRKALPRLASRPMPEGQAVTAISIPRAPYGGILVPRGTHDRIGGPNEPFVLYADDLEYSERLAATDGGLRLIPAAKVTDTEASWNNLPKPQRRAFQLATADAGFRLFYAVRNAVFLDFRRHGFDVWLIPNSIFFLLSVMAACLLKGRPRNAATVVRAFIDGATGRLGADRRYPLPG